MAKGRRKMMLNLAGACVVCFWLVLMGLNIQKNSIAGPSRQEGTPEGRPVISSSQKEWMEIFLKGKKVGYALNQITPLEENYLLQEEIFLRLNLLGQANSIKTTTRAVVDSEFRLQHFTFKVDSGVVGFEISGRVFDEFMELKIGKGSTSRTQKIPVKSRPMIGAGLSYLLKARDLKVGDVLEFPLFDPSTMSQRNMRLKVAERDPVEIKRIRYDAFRLESSLFDQTMKFWVDEKGDILKQEGLMGLTLVRSSAAAAPLDIDRKGGEDFYELAAVSAVGRIKSPGSTGYLKVRVKGLEGLDFDRAILNRGRQGFDEDILVIKKEQFPPDGKEAGLTPELREELREFLVPETNIESDDPLIVKKALEIRGNSSDPAVVAGRTMAWVHSRMEKRPLLSLPDASSVIRSMTGDCNEHAVLMCALLRASGIPARVCVGIVYARGSFYYHAWNECFLGGWVSLDATMNQMPADATHIKLAEGGLDDQTRIIGLIGRLGLEILEYR